jgi:hypothetical protein
VFRRIIAKLKDALFTSDCVQLERQGAEFIVTAYHGERAVPLARFASKSPVIAHLLTTLPAHADGLLVPPKLLPDVRQMLENMAANVLFQVEIAEDVADLSLCAAPTDFRVAFDWDKDSGRLVPRFSHGAEYLGRGWFLAGKQYWHIQGVTSNDDSWLRRVHVDGKDILLLLTRTIPEWRIRRLPFICDLKYYSLPSITVTIRQVAESRVIFDVEWRVNPESLVEVPSLPGYVRSGWTLMPGITPKQAAPLPASNGLASLEGQQIAVFFNDTLPKIKPCIRGSVEEFIKQHKVIGSSGDLFLTMRREPVDGIGRPAAVAIFSCGGYQYYAEKLSQRIQEGAQFVRVRRGWLSVASLKAAKIGPGGNTVDGLSLSPVSLTPEEVLRRGSPRLNGPWSRLEVPKELALAAGEPQTCARQHLEFLLAWRIPGGIMGEVSSYAGAFHGAIEALLKRAPQAKVLVIGEKAALNTFLAGAEALPHVRYEGGKSDPPVAADLKGLVVATPAAVTSLDALRQVNWTLLCIFEADDLIKSGSSRFYDQLTQYRRGLVIGSFISHDFVTRNAKRQAISRVWRLETESEADLVWTYGLRSPVRPADFLPPAFTIGQQRPSVTTVQPAEIPLADLPRIESMPIPPRGAAPSPEEAISFPDRDEFQIEPTVGLHKAEPTKAGAPEEEKPYQFTFELEPEPARAGTPAGSSLRKKEPRFTLPVGHVMVSVSGIGVHDNYSAQQFIKDAVKYVARREKSAVFVPFMCYWPTYDSMTPAQRKWYFYWRGQVRDGQYPGTDLSYIFVHVYELINNVGVRDGVDGYTQLFKLWTAYRDKYSKLDRYLTDWIADYLVVNKAAIDLATFYSQAMERKAFAGDPDILLSRYAKGSLNSFPMDLIDRLSDYRPRKSKFYNDGNSDLIEKFLPLSVGRVDACLRQKKGKGILQSYHPDTATRTRRFVFQSALYAGKAREIELPPVVPYSQYPPLREFMTSVVKHTENDLRAFKSCKSKLRGYSLDDDVKAAIDAFLAEAQGQIIEKKAAPRVVIDFARVSELKVESDEVRAMLLAGQQMEAEPLSVAPTSVQASGTSAVPSVERPADTPAGMLPDLDPVNRILSQLSSEERRLLDILRRCKWEAGDMALAASMPGTFVEAIVDRINNLALHQLPDMLILSEDGTKIVTEDYRDELEFLLSRQATAAPQTGAAKLAPDLPDDWAEFVGKLADYQLHVLRAILRQQDPAGEIRRLATERATMPETLIDQINELAVSTLGDVIIAPGSSPPVIEEEDVQMVEKVTQLSQ